MKKDPESSEVPSRKSLEPTERRYPASNPEAILELPLAPLAAAETWISLRRAPELVVPWSERRAERSGVNEPPTKLAMNAQKEGQ